MANYLLDTCTFLWASLEPEKLSQPVAAIFAAPDHALFLSAVSAWEAEMKYRMGRFELLTQARAAFFPSQRAALGVYSLPFDEASALRQKDLPLVHRDPFDRMLICQALTHDLTILTPDRHIADYPVPVIW